VNPSSTREYRPILFSDLGCEPTREEELFWTTTIERRAWSPPWLIELERERESAAAWVDIVKRAVAVIRAGKKERTDREWSFWAVTFADEVRALRGEADLMWPRGSDTDEEITISKPIARYLEHHLDGIAPMELINWIRDRTALDHGDRKRGRRRRDFVDRVLDVAVRFHKGGSISMAQLLFADADAGVAVQYILPKPPTLSKTKATELASIVSDAVGRVVSTEAVRHRWRR
jgi:hypothetical protein